MTSRVLDRAFPNVDRLWRRKRTHSWPNSPASDISKLNGWNLLATIPESDSVRSSETKSGRVRAKTVADLRNRVQDEQFRKIILDVLTSYLAQFSEYNHNLFGRLGPLLSELIKVRVEECIEGPCKIVSQVLSALLLARESMPRHSVCGLQTAINTPQLVTEHSPYLPWE